MNTIKPGIRTSEFWGKVISQLILIIGALGGVIPAQTSAIIVAVLEGLYNILRAAMKNPDITTIVDNSTCITPAAPVEPGK